VRTWQSIAGWRWLAAPHFLVGLKPASNAPYSLRIPYLCTYHLSYNTCSPFPFILLPFRVLTISSHLSDRHDSLSAVGNPRPVYLVREESLPLHVLPCFAAVQPAKISKYLLHFFMLDGRGKLSGFCPCLSSSSCITQQWRFGDSIAACNDGTSKRFRLGNTRYLRFEDL
jgi:hypothetical protein